MPFNASGVFQRLFSWREDRDAGTKILADRMDQETDGIAAAINDIVQGRAGFSGPILGTFGTSGSPAFSFLDDDDTGFYRSGANRLAASVGDTKVIELRQDEMEVLSNFKKGTFAIVGDFLSFENGDHWITYNDGAGNFNIRAGHKSDGTNEVHTSNGQGSVHLELGHEADDPRFSLKLGASGDLGDPVSWVQELTALASGALTWSGEDIWHAGNDGAGSNLDAGYLGGVVYSDFAPVGDPDFAGQSYLGDANARTIKLDNLEPVDLTEDGTLGYDKSQGLKLYRETSPGQATDDGAYTVLDTANITGAANINITSTVANLGDFEAIVFSVEQGPGSELDADTLDGRQGSYYQDADNLNAGTVPLDHLPTGDGAGLDADLLDGLHGASYLRRDQDNGMDGLLRMERGANEQIRLGNNTGAARNTMISFYDGEATRRGLVQARSDRMRFASDIGAELDLFGDGDVRINGGRVQHTGIAAGDIGSEAFANNRSGATLSYGEEVAGSSLRPAGESDGERSSQNLALSGTWECRGYAPQNFNTLFVRVA